TLAALSPDDRLLARHSLFVGLATENLHSITPEDFLIRNILGVHAPSESIGVAAHTRRGQILQFHLRDARASTLDLERAFSGLQPESRSQARGALLFSCLGRGQGLYGLANHESNLFTRVLPDVPLGGFFCNGEIGQIGGSTYVHGYTSCFGILSN
ncbi:MAG: FIST C-terminal domain-containing protein, partial [Candidatus Eremiobacteraeota bacterium]|nr:FIST C-terminal domain-containing protein [Candidatus Eremiobacteraeota bacterium]